jgi:ferredoxin
VRDSSSEISGECVDCGNCVAFCPVSAIKRSTGEGR